MTDNTTKLKFILEDLKTTSKINTNKIDLQASQIEKMDQSIKQLELRKDNTDRLKQSYGEFASSFNVSISNISSQIDTLKISLEEKLKIESEKKDDLKNELLKKIDELDLKIQTLNKMLDI